jgi:hypothetical protein
MERNFSQGIKLQERETHCSPPSNAKMQNGGAISQYLICLQGAVPKEIKK